MKNFFDESDLEKFPNSTDATYIPVVSCGDLSGIGLISLIKYLVKNKDKKIILFTSKAFFDELCDYMDYDVDIPIFDSSKGYGIVDINCNFGLEVLGKPNDKVGKFSYQCFVESLEFVEDKSSKFYLTLPVNKYLISKSTGKKFLGHTAFLEERYSRDISMNFFDGLYLLNLLSHHIPIKDVPDQITFERLTCSLQSIIYLANIFGIKPLKIAILGLNPHAGEGGSIGSEEELVIKPFIEYVRSNYPYVEFFGPLSPDSAYFSLKELDIKIVISLYHDQFLSIMKALSFPRIIEINTGLPFLRCTLAHGVGYSIAKTPQMVDEEGLKLVFDFYEKLICFTNNNS
ncbi:4-hydroxythreonine-4-phosphate dehydrogenase [Thermodesulfobium narugense DSM 14796]|uniref:4-hydroxythreonine-4-phosphate dehydrogenase n=1 Tax=Thermodesulfobium narugense DSM 14796 TaxID=747365 RepID=M1E6K3_9BACT|nr:4-hydroxythreonine-4-phosphate dehydrogenase PdxA [Thermodesulfobium narugense]AEE14831.1 4-hydroxythreonine-4-phosphate dehydrogenase [Thermodesulfobium narugense DSM 14796]